MSDHTAFRFAAAGVSFELRGSEAFVRRHLPDFLPFVERMVTTSLDDEEEKDDAPSGGSGLSAWYAEHVPEGARVTMQDQILVFALWMRGFKKYIFTSEDIRRAFEEIGEPEPKSLLQILGTLKRDHNLILGTERRGEYMLNTTGIQRARSLLDETVSGGGDS